MLEFHLHTPNQVASKIVDLNALLCRCQPLEFGSPRLNYYMILYVYIYICGFGQIGRNWENPSKLPTLSSHVWFRKGRKPGFYCKGTGISMVFPHEPRAKRGTYWAPVSIKTCTTQSGAGIDRAHGMHRANSCEIHMISYVSMWEHVKTINQKVIKGFFLAPWACSTVKTFEFCIWKFLIHFQKQGPRMSQWSKKNMTPKSLKQTFIDR